VRRRRADATRINPPTVERWTRFDLGVRCVPAQPTVTRLRSDHASEQQGAIMQGDPDVLRLLNEQLTSELTAINQYFLHSKMQENWGFTEVAGHTRAESFDEMRHAEAITDRILLLEGLPNYQRLFSLRIGQTLREQFEADLAIEHEVLDRLKPGIIMCREKQDTTSANLLEGIVADEENHVDYLETQLQLMEKLGEELYLAQCVSRPPTTGQAGH
jgi:bacterioferritin